MTAADITEGIWLMKEKRKNRIIAILEQLLPVVLALVCVLVMTINTNFYKSSAQHSVNNSFSHIVADKSTAASFPN